MTTKIHTCKIKKQPNIEAFWDCDRPTNIILKQIMLPFLK